MVPSQINLVGMLRITHFEFICPAHHLIPSAYMFNVFYYVSCPVSFYSFNSRTANVLPCSKDPPPKSLHDWKHKFFYIRRGVIPINMHYHHREEGIPKLLVVSYADEQSYKTLTKQPTAMLQLDEKALVAAGMSMLWAPTNPRGAYGFINALDPKVGGEMVTRLFPERVLPWLEQIKDYFDHPTEESLSANVANPTCAHPLVYVKPEAMKSPTRGGTILLSSKESTASYDLIHRSRTTRIGPNVKPPRGSEAAVHMEPATMDPEVIVDEPVRERPEVQTQLGVQTGKHSSRLRYLDYVVVSDTIYGLDVGIRSTTEEVKEDQATITQIMEKDKILS
ncbi:hypothetical protein Hdeb2414_s0022g00610131 [Helianthus debilis subsp. tardiflorus]